jgi:putative transferase (TIGR04331 family)
MKSLFIYESEYFKTIPNVENYLKKYGGSWCFENWENSTSVEINDFWHSNRILSEDIKYIQSLVQKIINELQKDLTLNYNNKLSLEHFTYLYYSWVFYIVFKLYGNWKMIEVCNKFDLSYGFDINYKEVLAENLYDSNLIYYFSKWNSFAIGEILRFKNIETIKLEWVNPEPKPTKRDIKSHLINVYTFLELRLLKLHKRFQKKKWVFYYFSKSYDLLPKFQKNRSDTRYVQLIYAKFKKELGFVSVDSHRRINSTLNFQFDNQFEHFLSSFIYKIIPISLMEGSHLIRKFSLEKFFQSTPEAVLYSDFLNNELLLYYLKNIPADNIYVYQHGGGFGLTATNVTEILEKFYCSRYVTWGWKFDQIDLPFIGPVPSHPKKKIASVKREGLCVMLYDSPPYIPIFQPTIYSSKFSRYLRLINDFLRETRLFDDLTLRLYPRNDSKVNLVSLFPEGINIDNNLLIDQLYSKYKLYIYTYNSTGFLELWNLNIPCILFIAEENWFTDDFAIKYYKSIKQAGLLFSDSVSLNEFLDSIQENIEVWWKSESIQDNLKSFLKQYSDSPSIDESSFITRKNYDSQELQRMERLFEISISK